MHSRPSWLSEVSVLWPGRRSEDSVVASFFTGTSCGKFSWIFRNTHWCSADIDDDGTDLESRFGTDVLRLGALCVTTSSLSCRIRADEHNLQCCSHRTGHPRLVRHKRNRKAARAVSYCTWTQRYGLIMDPGASSGVVGTDACLDYASNVLDNKARKGSWLGKHRSVRGL